MEAELDLGFRGCSLGKCDVHNGRDLKERPFSTIDCSCHRSDASSQCSSCLSTNRGRLIEHDAVATLFAQRANSEKMDSSTVPAVSRQDDFCSFEIELEADFLEAGPHHRTAQPVAVVRIKHQESAAARSDELAADGTILHSEFIPFVDLGIAHATGATLLVFPVLAHQFAKKC